jgi:hypothetical protein
MADRLADGHLADVIAAARAEGRSHESIARDLYKRFGIEVTRQTLANWERSAQAASP